jgi:peptidoglycan lytic transglycosylase G
MLETLPRRAERSPGRKRRVGLIVLLTVFVLLAGAVTVGGLWYRWAVGASGPQRPVAITIPVGATGTEVADLLKDNGVIRSTFGFRVEARFNGFQSGFDAGRYRLTTNMTARDALAVLAKGPVVKSVRATFPEGFTVAQMAGSVHKQLGLSEREFAKLANSGRYALPPFLPKGTQTVEGFLFPETYDFLADVTNDGVINRLLEQFTKEAATLPWTKARALKVTPYQIVILASLIEREAKFDVDRPKVAAVIYNRLNKHMPLEIDATIVYALGKTKPRLTLDDLKIDSPYNTYIHGGLPPTPIASPGLASLQAALNPADVDFLYYLTDSKGHGHFTASYSEFLQLKAKYLG